MTKSPIMHMHLFRIRLKDAAVENCQLLDAISELSNYLGTTTSPCSVLDVTRALASGDVLSTPNFAFTADYDAVDFGCCVHNHTKAGCEYCATILAGRVA